MITPIELQKTFQVLEGIVNSAVHPDIAVRVVMLELKPIRKEINRLKEIFNRESGIVETTQLVKEENDNAQRITENNRNS